MPFGSVLQMARSRLFPGILRSPTTWPGKYAAGSVFQRSENSDGLSNNAMKRTVRALVTGGRAARRLIRCWTDAPDQCEVGHGVLG